ncbi:unnamed protein product [Cuscuta epithymum]|uniref:Translocon at the inner envelope membrane of chloroplasts 214 n=1 Tax=Cuscuta epithymum TaxID=186058 RepID=A0AAV0E6T4_9ASTE|nr:unnamed protein product [Cuscuta epithymum]
MEEIVKIEQIFKNEKDPFALLIQTNTEERNLVNSKNSLLDWMGLNEAILDRPLTAEELSVFPEFLWFVNIYKMKPWIIPSQSLISNLNLNDEMTNQKIGKIKNKNKDKKDKKKTEV